MARVDVQQALQLLSSGAEGIKAWNQLRADGGTMPDLTGVGLAGLNLSLANLSHLKLQRSNLSGATLDHVLLAGATLRHVDLSNAVLTDADLTDADLRDADLRSTDLRRARLIDSNLERADLSEAKFGGTVIASDLSGAQGLEHVIHSGSSHISFDSIDRFNGNLPKRFLRGCWPNERIIDLLTSRSERGSRSDRSTIENAIFCLGEVAMKQEQNRTNIRADVALMGDRGATVQTGPIQIIKHSVVTSDKLDRELQEKLQQACQAIQDANLPEEDKKAVAADVDSVRQEMEKEEAKRNPDRIGKFLNRIKQLAPTVESIIRSAASVARLLGLG